MCGGLKWGMGGSVNKPRRLKVRKKRDNLVGLWLLFRGWGFREWVFSRCLWTYRDALYFLLDGMCCALFSLKYYIKLFVVDYVSILCSVFSLLFQLTQWYLIIHFNAQFWILRKTGKRLPWKRRVFFPASFFPNKKRFQI